MDALSDLYSQCRAVLLDCDEFQSHESLRAVFATSQLRGYANKIPEVRFQEQRVDECLRYLNSRRFKGEPILALFLEILSRSYPVDDDIHITLHMLAQKVRHIFSGAQDASDEVEVGIVIALKEEFRELLDEFVPAYTPDYDKDLRAYYYHFQPGAANSTNPYRCVATIVGSMGPTEAALATQKLIDKCKPSTLVVLGIAASLDDNVALGDVVVADVVDMYLENAKTIPDADGKRFTFQLSGEPYRTSHDLRVVAENFEFAHPEMFLKWQKQSEIDLSAGVLPTKVEQMIKKRQLRQQPQVHIGHIASGPTVAGALAFKEWLKNNRDRKYLALEMESGGFMAAVHQQGLSRSLVLRAISDYGDENRRYWIMLARERFESLLHAMQCAGCGTFLKQIFFVLQNRKMSLLPSVRGYLLTSQD